MTSKPVDLPADLASAYLALLSEREMLQAEHDVVVAERDTVVGGQEVKAGQKVVCKKRAEFNCDKAAQETMDCGDATATRYGYKPQAGDALDGAK